MMLTKGRESRSRRSFTSRCRSWKEVLTAMGVPLLMKEGYEADDLLGTVAKRMEKEAWMFLWSPVTGTFCSLQQSTS